MDGTRLHLPLFLLPHRGSSSFLPPPPHTKPTNWSPSRSSALFPPLSLVITTLRPFNLLPWEHRQPPRPASAVLPSCVGCAPRRPHPILSYLQKKRRRETKQENRPENSYSTHATPTGCLFSLHHWRYPLRH
jgi:hypothetical protein